MSEDGDLHLQGIVDAIRGRYGATTFVPLHAPVFAGREKEYVSDCQSRQV